MANIGKIAVQLQANTSQFKAGMVEASGILSRFSKSSRAFSSNPFKFLGGATASGIGMVTNAMKGLTIAAGAGALGAGTAFAYFTKQAMDVVGDLYDAAQRIGVTTNALAEMRYAANLAGIENEALGGSVQKMLKNISDAAEGTGTSSDALKAMGLNAKALRDANPQDAFYQIGQAISDVQNPADRLRYTLDIFGKSGGGLINLFADGADSVRGMAKEAQLLGLSISNVDAGKVEEAGDALDKVKMGFSGFFQQMAVKFAPFITDAVDKTIEWIDAMGGMPEIATKVFNAFGEAASGALSFAVDKIASMLNLVDKLNYGFTMLRATMLQAFSAPFVMADKLNKNLGVLGKIVTFSPLRNLIVGDGSKESLSAFAESAQKDVNAALKSATEQRKLFGNGMGTGDKFKAMAMPKIAAVKDWAKGVVATDEDRLDVNKQITDELEKQVAIKDTGKFTVGSLFTTALGGAYTSPVAKAAAEVPRGAQDNTSREVMKSNSFLQQIAANTARPNVAVAG